MRIVEGQKFKQVEVVLTQACSLRCNFCFEKGWGYRPENTMPWEDLKKVVDFCADAGVEYLFLTGGEPLLYPHLMDILEYIRDKGYEMKPTIATSGIYLEDERMARHLIECGIVYIDISLKGSDSKDWVKTTGYDGYNSQMKAIRNVSLLPVDFTCSMVVTMDNVQHVCDIVRHARDNGGKQFSFTFVIDNDPVRNQGKKYLTDHKPQTLISAFLTQIERLNALTDDWWIEYSFPLCVYTKKQLELLCGRLAAPCQVHMQDAITFSPSMELLSCDMFMEESLGQLGTDFNTFNEFLAWRSHAPYQDAINRLRRLPSSTCTECIYLQDCFGGCPVLWKHYSLSDIQTDVPF